MSNNNSKVCTRLQTFAQVAIASVFVYVGIVVSQHIEVWDETFQQGIDDVHTIQESMQFISENMVSINQSMNTIAYSMSSIDADMEDIKVQLLEMNVGIGVMNNSVVKIEKDIDFMNYNVRGIGNLITPQGFMGNLMPF